MEKILLFHHYGGIGGAGNSFLDIVDSLQYDFDLTVICPDTPDSMIKELMKRKATVIPIKDIGILNYYNGGSQKLVTFSSFRQILKIFKSYQNIDNIIKEFKGKIVVVNSMTLSWVGYLIKKNNKKGICFHRETYLAEPSMGTKIIKKMMKKYFDIICFISEYDKKLTSEIKEESKVVIYDRVRKDKFINKSNRKNKDSDSINLLYLGGFSKLKGAHIIVKAMTYLKKDNINLTFIGDKNIKKVKTINPIKKIINFRQNHYKKEILRIVEEEQLDDKISFSETTTFPEEFYKKSDIVIFPSTLPHQSRPIYEAGFAKKPIIITDFENTKEFIENEVTGFTFNNGSPKNLARIIKKVITSNRNQLNKIVNNNYRNVQNKNDYQSLRKDLLQMIEKVREV